jgi:hypothetical protein
MKRTLPLVVLALLASPAAAKPISTSLPDVLKRSQSVVIATYLGAKPTHRLLVHSVVWGVGVTGEREVKAAPGRTPHLSAQTRVLAFLEADDRWTFFAPLQPGAVATQALRIEGFYDFNAHLVRPNLLSLAELKRRLNTPDSKTSRRFRGALRFLKGAGAGFEDGPALDVVVSGGAARVSGLRARNLAPGPRARLSCGFGADLELYWSGSEGKRGLQLEAHVERVAADGTFEVRYYATRPVLCTRALFNAWSRATTHVAPRFRVSVASGGARMELELSAGGLGALVSGRKAVEATSCTSDEGRWSMRFGSGLELSWKAPATSPFPDLGSGLQVLLAGSAQGYVQRAGDKKSPATFRLEGVELR